MEPVSRRWVVGGLPLHVLCWDAAAGAPARPVVLVHGLCSSRYFVRQGGLLRHLGPVYAPDLPGFGASPDRDCRPTVRGLARAFTEWMDAAGLSGALVVANSIGCQVVTEALRSRPALATNVVMTGPAFEPGSRRLVPLAFRAVREAVAQPPWQMVAHLRDYRDAGVRRLLRLLRDAQRYRLDDAIGDLPMPVLVARGSRDAIAGEEWIALLAQRAPRGSCCTMEGVSHAPNADAPARFARLLARVAPA